MTIFVTALSKIGLHADGRTTIMQEESTTMIHPKRPTKVEQVSVRTTNCDALRIHPKYSYLPLLSPILSPRTSAFESSRMQASADPHSSTKPLIMIFGVACRGPTSPVHQCSSLSAVGFGLREGADEIPSPNRWMIFALFGFLSIYLSIYLSIHQSSKPYIILGWPSLNRQTVASRAGVGCSDYSIFPSRARAAFFKRVRSSFLLDESL